MKMVKIKVAEAIDAALDYLVAKCDGHSPAVMTVDEQWQRFTEGAPQEELEKHKDVYAQVRQSFTPQLCKLHQDGYKSIADAKGWRYSTDWSHGGPIIEREKIWLKFPFMAEGNVEAIHGSFGFPHCVSATGPNALIAAMRCYVMSELGETAEVPEELV